MIFHFLKIVKCSLQKLELTELMRILILLFACCLGLGCQSHLKKLEPNRFRHSSDFSEQVVLLTENVALIKFTRNRGEDYGKVNISIVQAHWGGEPEMASSSGYLVDKWLVTGAQRIAAIEQGKKIIVDTGYSSVQDPRYAIVDLNLRDTIKAESIEQLKEKAKLSDALELTWEVASIYFDKYLVAILNPLN